MDTAEGVATQLTHSPQHRLSEPGGTLASLGSRTPLRTHCPHLGLLQELDGGVTASIHPPGQLMPHPQGAPEQPHYIRGPWKEQNPL